MNKFLGILFCAVSLLASNGVAHAADAFDRVIESGKIRCGYLVYPPFIIKDEKTGEVSGLVRDVVEYVAKNANLKVEWAEEVPYDSIGAALDANRVDMFCNGLWADTARSRAMTFTVPFLYNSVNVWGRVNDTRFSSDINLINDPKVTIASQDGTMQDIIARTDFPLAKRLSIPANAPFSDNFVNITTGKADVSFFENGMVSRYVDSNPGTLAQLSPVPLRVFGNTLVVKKGEFKLKELLDQGIHELIYSGQIKKIVDKYKTHEGIYILPSLPYEIQK